MVRPRHGGRVKAARAANLDLDEARALYPGTRDQTYLDAAAIGLVATPVEAAVASVLREHALRGKAAAAQWTENANRTRGLVAELVGGRASNVAFTQNTSTGNALVANGIDWTDRDNIVVPADEFPSNFYPWTQLRRRGVEVREIPMVDGHADLELLAAAIDADTKVVAVSAVQYTSGYRYDLGRLGELCRARDALLVVDGTQAAGATVIDADASGVDALAVSAHKWMNGPLGIGFVHFSDRAMERLHPSTVGWLSVERPYDFDHEPRLADDGRRFESGTENAAGIAGLAASIGIVLDLGRAKVESTVLDLAGELEELLVARGLRVLREHDRAHASGILIATTGFDDDALYQRLMDNGVRCSLRATGVRFSPHYYNDSADLARAAGSLPA
ncbi:MAG: aminotransferase class V-fold PLP-dependent enzyme [Actinomycetota bacterium]|nr:aminotransferase class V-fold PLP-dependent enzyme [Actinomycetota bacterium]